MAIKGSKGRPAKNVVVRVSGADPLVSDLPQILHPMSSKMLTTGTGWNGDGTFDPRPGDTEYVDVLRYIPNGGIGTEQMQLVLQSLPKNLAVRSYSFTLTAQEESGQKVEREFQCELSDRQMRFYLSDSASP